MSVESGNFALNIQRTRLLHACQLPSSPILEMRKNIAVLLAGGVGSRLGADRPKQLLNLAGKTVLEHSIAAFEACAEIDEIAIVANAQWLDEMRRVVDRNPHPKLRHWLTGGAERYDSSLAALRAYEGADVHLIFHDAVRPAVSLRIISEVCQALQTHAAVNVVLPATDTMIEVDEQGRTIAVPDRSRLRRVQTPQGFHADTLREAYRRAMLDPDFRGTDDCGVAFRYAPEVDIALVRGEETNLKLTYPEDLLLLEHLLMSLKATPLNNPTSSWGRK